MPLVAPPDLVLAKAAASLIGEVSLELAADDGMYQGNDRHYLSCGASALNVILSAIQLADLKPPSTILDFGAGAGRVTRWLRAAFPLASIDACDLREQDVSFCRETFAARTWVSGIDIGSLTTPVKYDLIWLGSVATHLSADTVERMLEKAASWMNPKGLLVMSFHGTYALERQNSGKFRYIDDTGWALINSEYQGTGYGYANYPQQNGYGISITKPSWTAHLLERRPDLRLILLSETAWDGHHDILAVQKI